MPEGPSIVILKELVEPFVGKKIKEASGNTTKINLELLKGKTITDFKSWGKHFLICFKNFTVRIHFMLFGSYRINETKNANPRLQLRFSKGQLNFYACSVVLIEEDVDLVYDWSADVMSDAWSAAKAKRKLKAMPKMQAGDALLNQQIFAGVGNIIKNEVLYRIKVHPESSVRALPGRKLNELVKEAVNYSNDFLKWKKEFTLKKHWLAHTKKICVRCNIPLIKKHTGNTNRRSFFCSNCQVLYE